MGTKPKSTKAYHSSLVVVSYVPGTYNEDRAPFSKKQFPDITIHVPSGTWYFRKGSCYESSFKIGAGVRVPEDGEYWGPMMVLDMKNEEHRKALARALQYLSFGQLTP